MSGSKRLTRAYYEVTLRPNSATAQVAEEVRARLDDPSRPMHIVSMWSSVAHGPKMVSLVVRYEARGANANDVWRRICTATPLSKSQIDVVPIATFNLDVDESISPGVAW
jgi:hypothetical protein